MKLNPYLRRAVSWGVCLLICAALLVPAALADTNSFPTECSLTLEFPCEGLSVSLYKVAGVNANMSYNAAFSQFNSITGFSVSRALRAITKTSDWSDLAKTLRGYAFSLTPYAAGTTNALTAKGNYEVKFENLDPGLYLVDPQASYTWQGSTYTTAPYLIRLPERVVNADGEEHWETDIRADYSSKVEINGPQTTTLQVIKVWANNVGAHPNSIEVELWKDGQLSDTVTLSTAGWSYTWTDLDSSHAWSVVEKDSGGYTAGISYSGNTVIITNSLPDEPHLHGDPDDPQEEIDLDDPDVPLGPPPPDDPQDDSWDNDEEIELDDPDVPRSKLPQTGQLWWPVPLLALGGIFLFLIGWVRHRGDAG